MGGIGSGRRWHWDAKDTTDSMYSLDVRRLARKGLLAPGNRFGWHWSRGGERIGQIQIEARIGSINLSYRSRSGGDDWESMNYPVQLISQPCNLGGERQWFACPARGCGKRVALLYGGRIFACRHCYRLAYPSQREQAFQRYQRRADSIKSRLGWDSIGWGDWGPKPKGMHQCTFERRLAEIDHFEAASNAAFVGYFQTRFDSLGD